MPTFTPIVDPREKVREALQQVRRHKHYMDCRCGLVNGYCTKEEQTWASIMDRLLEKIPRKPR